MVYVVFDKHDSQDVEPNEQFQEIIERHLRVIPTPSTLIEASLHLHASRLIPDGPLKHKLHEMVLDCARRNEASKIVHNLPWPRELTESHRTQWADAQSKANLERVEAMRAKLREHVINGIPGPIVAQYREIIATNERLGWFNEMMQHCREVMQHLTLQEREAEQAMVSFRSLMFGSLRDLAFISHSPTQPDQEVRFLYALATHNTAEAFEVLEPLLNRDPLLLQGALHPSAMAIIATMLTVAHGTREQIRELPHALTLQDGFDSCPAALKLLDCCMSINTRGSLSALAQLRTELAVSPFVCVYKASAAPVDAVRFRLMEWHLSAKRRVRTDCFMELFAVQDLDYTLRGLPMFQFRVNLAAKTMTVEHAKDAVGRDAIRVMDSLIAAQLATQQHVVFDTLRLDDSRVARLRQREADDLSALM
ncbi:hypothetical protein J8273_1637 [Carpediemonas membranifera]|uniref:Uncharacterized protein n=1 Tax=Carpediemonas membranifera TaxID=201153 RepID=A0A8J6B0E1_9EUKA|nr:hypothetical protein J8273_1637 [Carpediemonas membranifera]|eukprot:KAG9396620.1 hypothetical protein J8273_1637 [Carpediemonas membranifera]